MNAQRTLTNVFIRAGNSLFLRGLICVIAVICVKLSLHRLGWEVISINPLFSGIIAANVFLMGFMLSGVLTDYKESERLPGEIACSLKSIAEDAWALHKTKEAPVAKECFSHLLDLTISLKDWFFKKLRTKDIMEKIDGLGVFFIGFEPLMQANFIVRLKQEQNNVRRMLIRIHTIRETSFISSGYIVAEITTFVLIVGLILAKIEPFYESLFFSGIITFLMIFLNLLIRDLDNPFGYYGGNSHEDVSLKPLDDLIDNLKEIEDRSRI